MLAFRGYKDQSPCSLLFRVGRALEYKDPPVVCCSGVGRALEYKDPPVVCCSEVGKALEYKDPPCSLLFRGGEGT